MGSIIYLLQSDRQCIQMRIRHLKLKMYVCTVVGVLIFYHCLSEVCDTPLASAASSSVPPLSLFLASSQVLSYAMPNSEF